jgi:predicted RNA binding protein YcfA (HicA-like mRNA interferase family)
MARNDVPQKAKPLVEAARRKGFVLVRRNKHLVFKHESGVILVTSATVSDRRALQNMEKQMLRLLNKQ